MKNKFYLYINITSIIFLIVGIIHFLKIVYGFEIKIMGISYPIWLSWVEMIIAFCLAIIGFILTKKH